MNGQHQLNAGATGSDENGILRNTEITSPVAPWKLSPRPHCCRRNDSVVPIIT
jgi:hypothetical protein